MIAESLVSSVLPATEGMAYSEVYSDPPGLVPLPEEEPPTRRAGKSQDLMA